METLKLINIGCAGKVILDYVILFIRDAPKLDRL